MATRKYDGSLGRFEYDDTEFQVTDSGGATYLHYVGRETDGSKIRVPEGIVDANRMFMGTGITSAPRLPEGVVRADYAYMECGALVDPGVLPSTLESAKWGYCFCMELPVTPDFPAGLKDMEGMFDNCPKLREAKRLPPGLENGNYCFANCPGLDGTMELPDGLERMDGMFLNCSGFGGVEAIPGSVVSAEDCLTGCESASMPEMPDGASVGPVMDRELDTTGIPEAKPSEPERQVGSEQFVRDGSELGVMPDVQAGTEMDISI